MRPISCVRFSLVLIVGLLIRDPVLARTDLRYAELSQTREDGRSHVTEQRFGDMAFELENWYQIQMYTSPRNDMCTPDETVGLFLEVG